ncbi:MAG: hypothetical protein ACOCYG_06430 [Spirochaetota bacterium]
MKESGSHVLSSRPRRFLHVHGAPNALLLSVFDGAIRRRTIRA